MVKEVRKKKKKKKNTMYSKINSNNLMFNKEYLIIRKKLNRVKYIININFN